MKFRQVASRSGIRLVRGLGFRSRQSLFGSRKLLFYLFVEPLFEPFLGILGNVVKPEPGEAPDVNPGYFGLNFHVDVGIWQGEFQMSAMPPSLMLVLVAFSVFPSYTTLTCIFTGWRK
jgi:hypothetical protein